MKAVFAFLVLAWCFGASAEQEFDIGCRKKDGTKVPGVVEFDSVGWSRIGLELTKGKLKVFNVFRAGEGQSLSFVDRNENGWKATNSFSYFSVFVVVSKADRRRFVDAKPFSLKLFHRDNDTPTGAARFDRSETLKCARLN